jgi:hypothetical protein
MRAMTAVVSAEWESEMHWDELDMDQARAKQLRSWIKVEVLKEWDDWVKKQSYASDHILTDRDASSFYEDYLKAKRRDLFSSGNLQNARDQVKLGSEKAEMLSPDKQGLAPLCVSLDIRS